jgi:hypothetical protein
MTTVDALLTGYDQHMRTVEPKRPAADLTARLRAVGFVPGETDTVVVELTAELATVPVLPGGAALRWVTADDDMHRIAAMQSAARPISHCWSPGLLGWPGCPAVLTG